MGVGGWAGVAASLALIALVLLDGFEAMLLPRRVTHQFRFARLYYVYSWRPWAGLARLIRGDKRRGTFLSLYGPLSILILFILWASGLVLGFALLQWSLGSPLNRPGGESGLAEYLYLSGVTFFTLGFGDLTPTGSLGRSLSVVEAGVGFGFLAVVISYLPVLYQAFSRREVTISLLDARAGSPPSASQLLVRLARGRALGVLDRFLEEWERWAAEVLESHISFPLLSYYRSQHDNQSWLGALTLILDTSSVVITGVEGVDAYQAQLTFAMARHVVVDLAQVYQVPPVAADPDRLSASGLAKLREGLRTAGLTLDDGDAADRRLAGLRGMYEPFLNALSRHFLLRLPEFHVDGDPVDNWETSAWMRRAVGFGSPPRVGPLDDHED